MIKNVSVDTTQTEPLLRVLDTVVIKLEGGTDDDLKILDEKPKETSYPERVFEKKNDTADDDVIITSVEKKRSNVDDEPKCVSPRPINRHKNASDDEENWDDEENDNEDAGSAAKVKDKQPEEKKKKSLKRKRTSSDSSSSSSSDSDSSSSSSSSEDEDDEKVKSKYDLEAVKKEDDDVDKEEKVIEKSQEKELEKDTPETEVTPMETKVDNKDDEVNSKQQNGEDNEVALETIENKPASELEAEEEVADKLLESVEKSEEVKENNTSLEEENKQQEDNKKDAEAETKTEEQSKEQEDQPETIDLDKVKDGPQPRALHRTSSIFLRNLAPSITKAEIEAICQKFDGYLRVAIADPLVERRWYRRGWVTFKRDVNIKEICWNLNNTRLRDCEMGAIVNRDLSRRVRPVNGMTAHKTIVRADIKLCAKIAMNLDEKFKLWVGKGLFKQNV